MSKLKVNEGIISEYLPKTDQSSKPIIDRQKILITFSSDRHPTPLWNVLLRSNISCLRSGWYNERMAPDILLYQFIFML